MQSENYSDNMTKKKRQRFNPEFKFECARLVLDQGYRISRNISFHMLAYKAGTKSCAS